MAMQDNHNSGQRVLAAIMFTDVVGFSMMMGRDEAGTLRALERDFALIEQDCAYNAGQVLKRTGDGLLMHFVSAADAVTAALAIQAHLHAQAKTLEPGQVLEHRMGIHLGDVVMTENDVVGDGVNVAQRLQGEARPGGICLSQTVYDVVKNKIKLNAVLLGPRNLKHLVDPVVVWSIPPLMGDGTVHRVTATPTVEGFELPTTNVAEPSRSRLAMVLLALIGALAIGSIGVVTILKNSAEQSKESTLAANRAAEQKEAKRQEEASKQTAPVTEPATTAGSSPAAPPKTDPPTTTPNPPATSEDADIVDPQGDLRDALATENETIPTLVELRNGYRFKELAEAIARLRIGGSPKGRQLVRHYNRLDEFMTALRSALAQIPTSTPLDYKGDRISGDGQKVFVLGSSGQSVELDLSTVPPETLDALTTALLNARPEVSTPPFNRGHLAFRREFGLAGGPATTPPGN